MSESTSSDLSPANALPASETPNRSKMIEFAKKPALVSLSFQIKLLVLWQSSLQSLPALSRTESEVALTEATRQNIWIRDLMLDLGIHNLNPTKVLEDNMSTIHLVPNS